MRTQGQNILARLVCGCIDRMGRTTGHCAALYPPPQLIHGVEFGRGFGQAAAAKLTPTPVSGMISAEIS